jgi:large subunit ribosomal protein L21
MAYAIIRSGGKQFRVAEGETVRLPSLNEEAGKTVEFDVLVLGGDNETRVGSPIVDGARVAGKRRKQYKRTQGHRQNYTAVKIDSIG